MLGFMLRRATGAAARTNLTATTRRCMSSEVSLAEEIKEMKKWKVCIVSYRYSLTVSAWQDYGRVTLLSMP